MLSLPTSSAPSSPSVKRAPRASRQPRGQKLASGNVSRPRAPRNESAPEEIDVLLAIAREINTHSQPELIVQKLCETLRPHIRFDAICLSTLENGTVCGIASSDPDHRIDPFDAASIPTHFLWPLLARGEMFDLSVPTTTQSENTAPNTSAGQRVKAYINVPLIVAGQIFGLLHIDSYRPRDWTQSEIKLARLAGAQIAAVVQGAHEIGLRREREAQLAQTLALLGATQEAAAEGICLVDTRGELISYNRRFAALWNLAPAQEAQLVRESGLMTHVLEQLADPDEFLLKIGELYDNPHARTRDEVVLRDGRTFERYSAPAIAPASEEQEGAGEINFGRVWTWSDVSNRKLYEAQLQHQAFHDALTGLPNRVLLLERLERALSKLERSRRALAVLFLDLDRFKIINDSLGHEKGDRLLKQVAARLGSCLRPGDTAARFGGDEFVILLEEVEAPDAAVHAARRIAASLQVPFDLDGHEVTVTTSIGIVLGHQSAESPDELMRKADIAMYRAKNGGKAQFHLWNDQLSEGALDRLQLEIDLQGAIKRGELEVWYQPIVDLENGERVAGYEALARWRHPQRGLVSPAEFIPIAEESGLIGALDAWVLHRACAQIGTWNAQLSAFETPLSVHVNLSARQFEQPEVAALVARVLQECGLPPAQLTLEITESAIMHDTGSAIAQLNELQKLGVGISIDDFGTGYSSLAYLEFLPVDSFKIDRAFVARLSQGTAIVRAIVSLSQALEVEVVAEGVETPEQLEQLRALGCRWAQGFWFSRPLPPAEIEVWMRQKVQVID